MLERPRFSHAAHAAEWYDDVLVQKMSAIRRRWFGWWLAETPVRQAVSVTGWECHVVAGSRGMAVQVAVSGQVGSHHGTRAASQAARPIPPPPPPPPSPPPTCRHATLRAFICAQSARQAVARTRRR